MAGSNSAGIIWRGRPTPWARHRWISASYHRAKARLAALCASRSVSPTTTWRLSPISGRSFSSRPSAFQAVGAVPQGRMRPLHRLHLHRHVLEGEVLALVAQPFLGEALHDHLHGL